LLSKVIQKGLLCSLLPNTNDVLAAGAASLVTLRLSTSQAVMLDPA
jgi:hypothetical protein